MSLPNGFVYLDEALPGVFWDAKYATDDNFTGSVVPGYRVNRVVGSRELADALRVAHKTARAKGYELFLFDGYRPTRAVSAFMRWAASPEDGKTRAAHYPNLTRDRLIPEGYVAERSGHSRGGVIDLTLCLPDGQKLDMGGEFDLMDPRSHHGADVPPKAQKNRLLLKDIMETSGFESYEAEWWHYRLCREPYPDTAFDFPIE